MLSKTDYGCKRVYDLGIIDQLIQKVNDTKERSRISYHGSMITLCYFLHNDYIFR